MSNLRRATLLLWSFLIISSRAYGGAQDPSVQGNITIHGIALPSDATITRNSLGDPIAASLKSPLTFAGKTYPSGTILLSFIDGVYMYTPPATSGSSPAAANVTGSLASLFNDRDLQGECGQHGYYTGALPAGDDDPQVHAVSRNDLINPSQLSLTTSPALVAGLAILDRDYKSPQGDLPRGTAVVISSDLASVNLIYFSAAGRLGAIALPAGTVVERGGWWGSYEIIFTPEEVKIGENTVAAGGYFMLAWDGTLSELVTKDALQVSPGLIAPPLSRVAFWDGRLSRVDLRSGATATYFGISLAGGHTACFDRDGAAYLRLGQNTTVQSIKFPPDSSVTSDKFGNLTGAFLTQDTTINTLPVKATTPGQVGVLFSGSGQIIRATLSAPTSIDGVLVKGEIWLRDDGSLLDGVLSGDQTIGGIPCMGDRGIQLNAHGQPISFTAAGPYKIGNETLSRGQPFYGSYSKSGVFPVLDATKKLDGSPADAFANQMTQSMTQIDQDLVTKAKDAILGHSSKFPFGNIGNIQDHDFRWSGSGNRLTIHQEFHVQNMFTNPPFADCDAELKLDVVVTWNISNGFMKQYVTAWPSQISGGYSHGVCPGTAAIETIGAALYDLFPHIRELIDTKVSGSLSDLKKESLIQKTIGDAALAELRLITGDPSLVPGSLKIDSLLIENGSLNLHYSYLATKQ